MKLKFSTISSTQISSDALEAEIERYLKKNYYRITEKGPGYLIFKDDEFSDRKRTQSDVYTRMESGKFEYNNSIEHTVTVKLIYLISVTYPFFLIMLMCSFGVYFGTISPIIMSLVFTIPIIFKVFYIKGNVLHDILLEDSKQH